MTRAVGEVPVHGEMGAHLGHLRLGARGGMDVDDFAAVREPHREHPLGPWEFAYRHDRKRRGGGREHHQGAPRLVRIADRVLDV